MAQALWGAVGGAGSPHMDRTCGEVGESNDAGAG
jgi:hypothetical protein